MCFDLQPFSDVHGSPFSIFIRIFASERIYVRFKILQTWQDLQFFFIFLMLTLIELMKYRSLSQIQFFFDTNRGRRREAHVSVSPTNGRVWGNNTGTLFIRAISESRGWRDAHGTLWHLPVWKGQAGGKDDGASELPHSLLRRVASFSSPTLGDTVRFPASLLVAVQTAEFVRVKMKFGILLLSVLLSAGAGSGQIGS